MICILNCLSTECRLDFGKAAACLPVKVRPNISSSGGWTVLGVVVLAIDSVSGFISGNWASFSSCDFML